MMNGNLVGRTARWWETAQQEMKRESYGEEEDDEDEDEAKEKKKLLEIITKWSKAKKAPQRSQDVKFQRCGSLDEKWH